MNIKTTNQRERIIEVVRDAHAHLTADQVYGILQQEDHSIGVATVYRNLKYLYEHRIINRIQHPDYGYVYDANLSLHYHFHCIECNEMTDIEGLYNEELNRIVEEKYGGKVYNHMTVFQGVCDKCLKNQKKESKNHQ